MASLGFVVVAVLLASVAAAPTEDTTRDENTTSTTETAIKCTLTDYALKFSMKSVGVITEDGRFVETGAVTLMDVLASAGLYQDQKPRDVETVKQAAKACLPVLNDNFVDSCKRPAQIMECLSAEYDKITNKGA